MQATNLSRHPKKNELKGTYTSNKHIALQNTLACFEMVLTHLKNEILKIQFIDSETLIDTFMHIYIYIYCY